MSTVALRGATRMLVTLATGFALGAAGRSPVHAQGVPALGDTVSTPPDSVHGPELGAFGISFSVAIPVGEFAKFVDAGYGIAGFGRVYLDDRGIASLRLDAAFHEYGSTTTRRPLFPGDQRVLVDITTSNTIVSLGLGPQIAVPLGRVRSYVNGGVGFSYFSTDSQASGTDNDQSFASSNNFSDITFASHGGGGLLIHVFNFGDIPVSVDLSTHYLWNGKVQYLTSKSLVQLPDGSVIFEKSIESEANMMLYQIGLSIGVAP